MTYLIWSFKRSAWWRPGGAGYTRDVWQAGKFNEAQAKDIRDTSGRDENDPERSVPVDARLIFGAFTADMERRKEEELERINLVKDAWDKGHA